MDAILFDLDSTLCRPRRPPDVMVAEAFDRANLEPYCTAADLSAVASERVAATADSELDYYIRCFEAAAEQAGVSAKDAPAVARAYDAIGGHSAVELLPGAKEVLRSLEGTYSLGIITNGMKEIQQTKVDTLGIGGIFDTLVFATPEIGYKPDSNPFERALDTLDATPDSTAHVGDSLRADVVGANAMGIQSVWIPRETGGSGEDIEPDHTLDSLSTLPALLNR